MATKTENVGTRGRIRVNVDLVSQDLVNNTSIVRVRGYVWITSGTAKDDSGKCKAQITGTNYSEVIVVKGGYSSTARLIIDRNYTVPHNGDGNIVVTYSFVFGPSTSSYLGKGGTTTVSMTLPLIPLKPYYPYGLNAVITVPNSVTLSYNTPVSNTAVLEYQVAYSKTEDINTAVILSAGTSLSKTISNLDRNSTYYFWVRARNVAGFGDWSPSVFATIPDVPNGMTVPGGEFIPPTSVIISFTPPSSNGGLPITGYDVQYSQYSDFIQATTKTVSESPVTITNLLPTVYYFRVRSKNAAGDGRWSGTRVVVLIGGPKIILNGVHRTTLVFVKYEGSYRTAIPYVKSDGVWRIAGG